MYTTSSSSLRNIRAQAYKRLEEEQHNAVFKEISDITQNEKSKTQVESLMQRNKELEERLIKQIELNVSTRPKFIRANGIDAAAKTYMYLLARKAALLDFLDKNAKTTRPAEHTTKPLKELELVWLMKCLSIFESEEFFKCHMGTVNEVLRKKAGLGNSSVAKQKTFNNLTTPTSYNVRATTEKTISSRFPHQENAQKRIRVDIEN